MTLNLETLELKLHESAKCRNVVITENTKIVPPTPSTVSEPLVKPRVAGVGRWEYYGPTEDYKPDDDVKLYYAVLAFPEHMKFKLKVKHKQKVAKYDDFTRDQQLVIFKRKVDTWREIFERKAVVIPEYTKSCNLHYNIIYASRMSMKDQKIIFNDAYGMTSNVHANKYFANIQEVYDYDKLYNDYLINKSGIKSGQQTNIRMEFLNA